MRRPNLFIVGAPKCGTTSLHQYLSQHPQVFMSRLKEPHYFARDIENRSTWCARSFEEYLRHFEDARDHVIVGESSTWYLYSHVAAQAIKECIHDVFIIAMIRNPIDAMYSLHGQFLWTGNEDILSFE